MLRLGLRMEQRGIYPERGAVISNHLSYVDIVTFAALHPCVFVAKAEIKRWPFLGWLTTMAGTVYVERGRGGSAAEAASSLRETMESGVPVVFYPEGTTSNGSGVLPFHSGLLAEVLQSGQPVTAAAIRYTLAEENTPGVAASDDVAYWGDRAMLPHIARFLGLRGVQVEVQFAETPVAFSAEAQGNRKLAAVEAREAVCTLRGGC